MSAVIGGDSDPLQIGFELPRRNAGDLGTNTAEVLPLTTDGHLIADLWAFAANVALPGHVAGPSLTTEFVPDWDKHSSLTIYRGSATQIECTRPKFSHLRAGPSAYGPVRPGPHW